MTASAGVQASAILERGCYAAGRRAVQDLTAGQHRSQLVSGRAHPVVFKTRLVGSLLLASDGLLTEQASK